MNAYRRVGLIVIGLAAGVLGVFLLLLASRSTFGWGTGESLFVMFYVTGAYVAFGVASVGFLPRSTTGEYVAGAGALVAAGYLLAAFYYLFVGAGGLYLPAVLIGGFFLQAVFVGVLRGVGHRFADGQAR